MPTLSLQEFVEDANGGGHLRVEHDFGDGFVRLRTSEAERRQAAQDIQSSENIVLELLRNSRDAHAAHVFLSVSKEGSKRLITVLDDGDGIPASMHRHVFEPRVTSKLDTSHMDAWGLHGRGMALFSISENATCAAIADSSPGLGCSVHVETDTDILPEKADQSSFPQFVLSDDSNVSVRGPRNILRTACEFAVESRGQCSVYVGSPAEIAATMHAYGAATLSAIDRVFCADATQLPIAKRLAAASDPQDLADMAGRLGLDISPRTARRILDGQIDEAPSLLERITIAQPGKRSRSPKRAHRLPSGKAKVQRADAEAIADAAHLAFSEIADAYYLVADVKPSTKVSRDRITITIPLIGKLD